MPGAPVIVGPRRMLRGRGRHPGRGPREERGRARPDRGSRLPRRAELCARVRRRRSRPHRLAGGGSPSASGRWVAASLTSRWPSMRNRRHGPLPRRRGAAISARRGAASPRGRVWSFDKPTTTGQTEGTGPREVPGPVPCRSVLSRSPKIWKARGGQRDRFYGRFISNGRGRCSL